LLALPTVRYPDTNGGGNGGGNGGSNGGGNGDGGGGGCGGGRREESRTVICPADRAWRVHSACCMPGWPGLDPPAHARLLEPGADEARRTLP